MCSIITSVHNNLHLSLVYSPFKTDSNRVYTKSGLAWPGLAWPGLAWPGPAWPDRLFLSFNERHVCFAECRMQKMEEFK